MILTALNQYYDRLVSQPESAIAPIGYSYEKISYGLVISPEGELVDVMDLRDTSEKRPRARLMLVPQPPLKRSGKNPPPAFLWDNTKYVLGVTGGEDGNRAIEAHKSFKEYHEEVLATVEDEGLIALWRFLRLCDPEHFKSSNLISEEMLDTNIVFRLDGEKGYIHERKAAKQIKKELLEQTETTDGICLVTGKHGPVARVHPPIKGVKEKNGSKDAQSMGGSIVTFNKSAYESYGKFVSAPSVL